LRKGNKLLFEDVQRLFEWNGASVGFEDEYQESGIQERRDRTIARFHAAMIENAATSPGAREKLRVALENNVIVTAAWTR